MYKISDEMHKYFSSILLFLQTTKTLSSVKTLINKGIVLLKKIKIFSVRIKLSRNSNT